MKKNENASKKVAAMMKNLRKDQLETTVGGVLPGVGGCPTCGLLHKPGI
jgi:hypothetical protein